MTDLRQTINQYYRIDETQAIEPLLAQASLSAECLVKIHQQAYQLVEQVRKTRIKQGGIDAFMQYYDLSTDEGIALMCIAEAMLRIPDKTTVEKLIRDKLAPQNWRSHIGNSQSTFVDAATWALMLTGKIITDHQQQSHQVQNALRQLVKRLSQPAIRKAIGQAMRIIAKQFVMGRDIAEATKRAKQNQAKGYCYSYDMLGEAARTMVDAERYYQAYYDAIHVIGKANSSKQDLAFSGISIKLSALHPRYQFSQQQRILQELPAKVLTLAQLAKQYNIGFTIDAEEADRLDLSLDIIEQVFLDPSLAGWQGFGLAVQAYQKRAPAVLDYLIDLARRANRRLRVRLVKGAYWDSEIKHSQEEGFDNYPVYTRKANTDVSYLACAKKMLAATDSLYPQFATHNAYSVAAIMVMLAQSGRAKNDMEFQCLHGMGESLYDQIIADYQTRIYAPVGRHKDLLPYLVRRLLENGANSSFVNRIVDSNLPIEALIADPVAYVKSLASIPHPGIALPGAIYGEQRRNSSGIDFSDTEKYQQLQQAMQPWLSKTDWQAAPTLSQGENSQDVHSPQNLQVIGELRSANANDMNQALEAAQQAYPAWAERSPQVRADILRNLADLLQENHAKLIALATREAGKTLPDAVNEVREAIDFCRYYAMQAESIAPAYQARGVVLCISPWNFPLAIFLGQVTAALVVGNCVLAKPAEPTSLIAALAVDLLHQAGVPEAVVQLIPGRGSVVGKQLISDRRIRAVMFTGSTDTAQTINSSLAARGGYDVPLIAETGGQNVMIVDSSALPEQVIDDVILSAFGSAGQRCSALRVLCLQEDIADNMITMLKHAMREIRLGDPQWLSTDVGPVIDKAAQHMLQVHAERMQTRAKLIAQVDLPEELNGHFFAPRAFEIESISQLTGEVFGPILHVVRYQAKQLDQLLADINATGFGLTMGIHSRIDANADYIHQHTHIGNTYINRNMIGAVVGVQPFGGEGLSGTGPKAGGPHYLLRLMQQSSYNVMEACSANDDGDTRLASCQQAISKANKSKKIWASIAVAERAQSVNDALQQWQQSDAFIPDEAMMSALQTCQSLSEQAIQQLSAAILLPGPTGEHNQLELHPRGVVLCIAGASIATSLPQCYAALLAGNSVVWQVSNNDKAIAEQFSQTLSNKDLLQVIASNQDNLQKLLTEADAIDAVMLTGSEQQAIRIHQQLAKRQAKLMSLIISADQADYIVRLSCERTLTENTTAKGGNAALLSLSE